MEREIKATDPEYEREKGRVALWLDPDDLRWLARHCCCAEDAPKAVKDRCGRVRFRAMATLHKAGFSNAETHSSVEREAE